MVMTPYLDKDVQVGSLRLHYQEWGAPTAPPIVMLHGFGVSGHMFDEFAARMMDRFRLIAVDQRGHGDSDWSDEGDYSRDAFVADAEGFREALGLDRFVLMGHSMGGLNAVSYAVKYPQRVRALVLVDVGPEAAKEGVDNILRFTQGPDELEFEQFVEGAHRFNPRRSIDNIRERMRHRLKPTEGGKWTWKFDKRFRQGQDGLRIGGELSNDETWQLFRSVTAPTLLVRGAESDVLTQEVAERAVREMPRARLALVAEAGHSVPGDNPDDFTDAVRSFLADVEEGRFQPIAASEPPPLLESVREQQGRRGSLLPMVAAGVGAVFLLSAVGWLVRGRQRRRRKGLRARAAATAHRVHVPERIGAVDLEMAQRRAADLTHELVARGRSGLHGARAVAAEVDVEAARAAARDVLHSLGETSREAPARARKAARRARADAERLRPKKKRGGAATAFKIALAVAPLVAGRTRKRRKKRGVLRGWRS